MTIHLNVENFEFTTSDILKILENHLHINPNWYIVNGKVCEEQHYTGDDMIVDGANKSDLELYNAVKARLQTDEK